MDRSRRSVARRSAGHRPLPSAGRPHAEQRRRGQQPDAGELRRGALGKRGLLVKDGGALERLAEADIALFDKTGTLTLGEPRPDLATLDANAKPVALALAQTSRHPLSRGLAAALAQEGVVPARLDGITESPGSGVTGSFGRTPVTLGPC